MSRAIVACLLCVSAGLAAVNGAQLPAKTEETSRGQGHSQQYHYSSFPEQPAYAGLSFDLTLLPAAIGAIILLLAFSALIYPLLKSGHNSGWDSGWSRSIKNNNNVITAEKVLTAVEKLYEAYNKIQ